MSDESPTLEDLHDRAGELNIPGRSSMNREELERAIATALATGSHLREPINVAPLSALESAQAKAKAQNDLVAARTSSSVSL